MSKITNDGLTRSGTGCFIAVPIRQQQASLWVIDDLPSQSLALMLDPVSKFVFIICCTALLLSSL